MRVSRRAFEAKMSIEVSGLVVFGVNQERPHSDKIGDLQGAAHGIEQQSRPEPPALHCSVNRQTRQHEDRDRIARHSFGDAWRRVDVLHLADDERVKSDDLRTVEGDVGLRGIGLLRLQRVAIEEAIQVNLSTDERLDGMFAPEFFDTERTGHGYA